MYIVFLIDGAFVDAADAGTSVIRFDGLTWDEALNLARMGLEQGYDVVFRQEEVDEHGEEERSVL